MPARRWVSLTFVVLLAAPWSAAMTIVGLRLLGGNGAETPGWLPAGPAGVAAIASGQLVFMLCVCDRVFPRASRAVSGLGEAIAGVTLLAALGGAAVALAGGR